MISELELADWRRQVNALYATVRAATSPASAHATWRAGRDRLFIEHPQSPLSPDDPLRQTGLPYWPYDPNLRFVLPLITAERAENFTASTAEDELTTGRRLGWLELPDPVAGQLAVWWLEQYGGGLFVPVHDATAGSSSYGGGRYLLDTTKGADLGVRDERIVVDLNFLYHPSCRYDERWRCPLAPAENRLAAALTAGERL